MPQLPRECSAGQKRCSSRAPNDYKPVGGVNPFDRLLESQPDYYPLYNGNIAGMAQTLPAINQPTVVNSYRYDHLNRIKANLIHQNNLPYSLPSYDTMDETFAYDGNGNITKSFRHGDFYAAPKDMDDLTYNYNRDANEHVLAQLVIAYFEKQKYDEVIRIAKKIYRLPQFMRSKAHILYARALENTGNTELAENEFKAMKGRYSYFGPRYEYGLFLVRAGHLNDAKQIFDEMLNEEQHLGSMEKRTNRVWFTKAKEKLRKIGAL